MAITNKNINRKEFFDSLFANNSFKATDSLEEYTTPLTIVDVYHLLKRCCFVIDDAFAQTLVGKTANVAVNLLITNAGFVNPPLPNFDINQAYENPEKYAGQKKQDVRFVNLTSHFEQNIILQEWWIDQMKKDGKSLAEKMAFFWHSHFTTKYDGNDVIPAQWMYRQNVLFRKDSFGNFRKFLEEITIDGAMLMFLNGSQNSSVAPNENYARELMELYSIGLDEGNYTEDDIRQAARVLTGWRVNYYTDDVPYKVFFVPQWFSDDEKTVLGQKFVTDYEINKDNVYKNSIQRLIDVILTQKGDEVALFMAKKFYRYFVFSKPIEKDENVVVNKLAAYFKSNNFDVKTTLVKLLTSQHFFDPETRGIQIKNPLENLLRMQQLLTSVDTKTLNEGTKYFGLEPLNPPNVSGWKGYRNWITTKTLPAFIAEFSNRTFQMTDKAVGDWAAKFTGYNDAYQLTENIALLMLGKFPEESRLEKLENVLLGGAPYYEWPQLAQSRENAGLRVKALLREIYKMPDFYLS